jgi:hypothetical protein
LRATLAILALVVKARRTMYIIIVCDFMIQPEARL